MLGGSADLTPSNNTKAKGMVEIRPGEYNGSYMHYGVREHGMAAAMNGIALHGGLIPYGGTFLCFSDYCRPSIRLAALMQIRTIFVMTHDSIGLGEDGPTHQPVEHLAALRAIPHLAVYRPGDPVETAECWELILDAPRQRGADRAVAPADAAAAPRAGDENKSAKGGYVLLEAEGGERKLTHPGHRLRTASRGRGAGRAAEGRRPDGGRLDAVPPAVRAAGRRLQEGGAGRERVRASRSRRRSNSAGTAISGFEGRFVGMHGFGASGKIADVYKKFDINDRGGGARGARDTGGGRGAVRSDG